MPFKSCVGPSGILRSSSDPGNKSQEDQQWKQIQKRYYENMGLKYSFEKNSLYVDCR